MIKIQVILGSTRQGRQGKKVANWFMSEAQKSSNMEFELLDLKEWNLPFFDEAIPPMGISGNYSDPQTKKFVEKIAQADGYVFLTPEYNHSYSAVLKNALDAAYFEWNKKPGAIVSYSGTPFGGTHAAEQLRLIMTQLQLVPVFNIVKIPNIFSAFDEQGQPIDQNLSKRAAGLLEQLGWWATLLKPAREALK